MKRRTYKTRIAAAKAYAARKGVKGRPGGWLYHNETARTPICQGWYQYAERLMRSGVVFRVEDRFAVLTDEEIQRRTEERFEKLIYGGKTKVEWEAENGLQ